MNDNLRNLIPDALKNVKLSRVSPPPTRDTKQLPYGSLDAGQFELFCCELLSRTIDRDGMRFRIIRIEPLAGDGKKQYGADIFVERANSEESWVELFEVKRVERFDRSVFRTAVDRFADNREKWGYDIRKFVVISSERLDADLIIDMKSHMDRHPVPGVVIDIWSATKLDQMLSGCESLVFKYFHPAWTEILFGEKAREHYEKYGIYEFDESASWVNYDGPSEVEIGDAVTIQNDHVKIHGFLPTLRSVSASCLVELRNGRFSHVLMTLNHRDLVGRYFVNPGAPLDNDLRDFLLPYYGEPSMWFCDIGNCRLKISEAEARDLCNAFDRFAARYMKRLQAHEASWRSEEFSVYEGIGYSVPLMTVKRGLWRLLLAFADAHDVFETDTEWSMFESSGTAYLKVMTRQQSERFDPGFHVFIRPTKANPLYQSFDYPDTDVLLAWCPPQDLGLDQFEGKVGPRYYWDVATTYEWMVDELIPAALKWDQSRQHQPVRWQIFKPRRSKSRNRPETFDIDNYIRSCRHGKIENTGEIDTVEKLLAAARRLQSFFSSRRRTVYVSKENYKLAFSALGTIMKHSSCDDFGYLHGNLGYLRDVHDMPSLTQAVVEHAATWNDYCANNFKMDCLFRCFNAVLDSGTCRLNAVEIQDVAKQLDRLLQLMRQVKLLDRQQKRLAAPH
ncbi:hypothetical protein NUV26_23000 [Burkholderia pseudomultivorans]|uniref:hypothetical protein n=1 Tax=Burkholderia pseudomultivorans TaxID=1207504 RepID=UPI0008417122|nr:hypothetical protein [Burkholderia pseudomultivorans]AOI88386.1 hypothetical protein WS57_06015 [Burkholderia pseudomultivorans]MDS0795044.1 hypothetical protein [Burkholderia pseudomultivorans]